MESNFDLLPLDSLKEVLFQMPIKDIINYCRHSKTSYDLCDTEEFWEGYIESKYDMELLKDIVTMAPGSLKNNDEVFEELINLIPSENVLPLGNPYFSVAVYLDNSKFITFQQRKDGILDFSKPIIFSKYDYLRRFLGPNYTEDNFLYGLNIMIYIDEDDKFIVKGLRGQPVQLKIKGKTGPFNMDNVPYDDLLIDDITINDIPLFDLINTFEDSYSSED